MLLPSLLTKSSPMTTCLGWTLDGTEIVSFAVQKRHVSGVDQCIASKCHELMIR